MNIKYSLIRNHPLKIRKTDTIMGLAVQQIGKNPYRITTIHTNRNQERKEW
jgi:hypothetical protein